MLLAGEGSGDAIVLIVLYPWICLFYCTISTRHLGCVGWERAVSKCGQGAVWPSFALYKWKVTCFIILALYQVLVALA